MARFQQRRLGPFGGLNQDENPLALRPNELVVANDVAHRGSTLATRPGCILEKSGKQYDEVTTGENAIQGLHEHRENVDAGRHLIAVGHNDSTKRVFYTHEDLLTNVGAATITAGQDNVWTFATHNNKTYAAGGANADHFWYWDGDTANPPTQIDVVDSDAVTMLPNYVFAWRNYLFLGGFNPASPLADNNASVVRFPDFATDPTTAANWKAGNTIGFTAYGSSHNTGIASYKDNKIDALLILYNDHIDAVELNPQSGFNVPFFINDKISNGCVGQRAYVDLGLDGSDGLYMSERGFHSLRQSQEHGSRAEAFLSWKIRPLFKTLNTNRLKYTVGAYDFKNGRVLFAVSTGSNSYHDTILCLDVKDNDTITADNARWSKWKIGGSKYINELKMLRDEDNIWRMYFGTTTGEVGYFDDDTFEDFGSSYRAEFRTADDPHGSTLTTKGLGDVMVTIGPSGNHTPEMKFYFDYGNKISTPRLVDMPSTAGGRFGSAVFGTDVFGSSESTVATKVYGAGSGQTIGFGVSHSGDEFQVGAIDYQVRIIGEDTGDTA